MSHSDEVTKIPKGFKVVASSTNSKFAIIESISENFYGIQFHPEVTHTQNGKKLLKNFIFRFVNLKKTGLQNFKKILINNVKNYVGSSKVICALSGGVDSSVVAKLLKSAIGKNLICIFVNTGLLRKK